MPLVEKQLDSSIALRWKLPAAIVLGSWTLLLLAMHRTVFEMVHTWYHSRTYSHGFLIFPLFGFLVWIRRRRLQAVSPVPNFWGLPLFAVLALVWLAGNLGEVRVLEEFALVAMLVTLVWALLGSGVAKILSFPLAFLFFAVPFGQSLIGPLQDFTARFAVHALTLSKVPAVLDGRIISLPSTVWSVAEACSGIRYLFSSLVVGTIYASLVYRSRFRQLVFIAASALIPVVANGARAYGIILLAYLTNNPLAVDVDHVVYGGVFFLAVNVALLSVGLLWREKPLQNQPAAPASAVAKPVLSNRKKTAGALALATMLIILASVLQPLADYLWNRSEAESATLDLAVSVAPPWRRVSPHDSGWTPDLHGADREVRESYQSGNNRVDLYTVLYSGRVAMELINGYNRLENSKTWVLTEDGVAHASVNGQRFMVQRSLIESNATSRSVWNWYWVAGEYTESPARVKLLQAKARLFGKSTAAVVTILSTESEEGDAADRVLQDFLSHASFNPASEVAHSGPAGALPVSD